MFWKGIFCKFDISGPNLSGKTGKNIKQAKNMFWASNESREYKTPIGISVFEPDTSSCNRSHAFRS